MIRAFNRLIQWSAVLALLVLVASLALAAWLTVTLVKPVVSRFSRKRELEAARRAEIDQAQHQWALANVAQAREDVDRHRSRLENDLDELHQEQQ